jgi:hypothetical protein
MVTETDDVARALDAAGRIWPELRDNRAALLRRVLKRGSEAIEREDGDRRARRLAAIRAGAGVLTGGYPPNWREQLRDEWPD